jgi:serine/threonine protein kinase
MLYLHDQKIVHRDLKSHNVLLDEYYNIKLCDFGLAKPFTDLNSGPCSSKFSGTPAYMAPEILQKKSYTEKVDIFAFGILIWEIFTRKIPYEGNELVDLKQRVLAGDKLYIPKNVPKDIEKVINLCINSDPNNRPSFIELSKMSIDFLNK